MNKLVKIFAIVLCVFSLNTASAQTAIKFGHIESNKLMSIMPEMLKAQENLKTQATEMDSQMQSMRAEYERLVKAFQDTEKTTSDLVKQTKIKEIQDAEQRIQIFTQHAQKTLQEKREGMMKPIIEKANAAIKAVGEEKGFVYIFDLSAGNILYHSVASVDVLPLVKKKLGIL
jgi:outer membrane protein